MCIFFPLCRGDRVAFLFSVKTSDCLNQCQSTTGTGTEGSEAARSKLLLLPLAISYCLFIFFSHQNVYFV